MTQNVKSSLLLFGMFSFGFNCSALLHELGHALAMWSIGGGVKRITLHPFSTSYTYYESASAYPVFTNSAGLIFGVTVGLVLLAATWRWRNSWVLPLQFTAIYTLIGNGIYFAIDGIVAAGGDATNLILIGVPKSALVGSGVFLFLLGLLCVFRLLPRVGIGGSQRVATRMAILHSGVGSYLLAILTYQLVFNRGEIVFWLVSIAVGLAAISILAICSAVLDLRRSATEAETERPVSWSATAFALSLGLGMIAVDFLVFPA